MSAPRCIGIILDGNRRWARREGLPSLEGHRRGSDRLIECVRWVRERGIAHLAVYAFSTENWNRAEYEVSYLLDIFRELAEKKLSELAAEGVRIRFIGKLDMLPADLQASMARIEAASASNTAITVWICMSYGGRAEIAEAAKATVAAGAEITEDSLRNHFWSADMPDPDLIIRPGGQMRLSNFLLWQAAYSELFFIEPYWPEFSEELLDAVLAEYAARERRIGQ